MIGNIKKTFLPKTGMQEKFYKIQGMSTMSIHAACNMIRSNPNSFHCVCQTCRYKHSNYNVDSNMKSLNYSKVQFRTLIYFELQQNSIKTLN